MADGDGVDVLNAMNAMLPASEMPAHPSSPTLQSEHMAAMDLAPPQKPPMLRLPLGIGPLHPLGRRGAFLTREVGSSSLKGWF